MIFSGSRPWPAWSSNISIIFIVNSKIGPCLRNWNITHRIYSYLHYGIMSWGNTYPSRLSKVQTKQNKCIRCIFFSHNRESSGPYLKFLDISNVDNIFKFKISFLAHKFSQNEAQSSEVSQNYLVQVSDIYSHNTRYASNLNFEVPRVRSNYGNTHLSLP